MSCAPARLPSHHVRRRAQGIIQGLRCALLRRVAAALRRQSGGRKKQGHAVAVLNIKVCVLAFRQHKPSRLPAGQGHGARSCLASPPRFNTELAAFVRAAARTN